MHSQLNQVSTKTVGIKNYRRTQYFINANLQGSWKLGFRLMIGTVINMNWLFSLLKLKKKLRVENEDWQAILSLFLILTRGRCGRAWLGWCPTWRLLIYLHLMAAKTQQLWALSSKTFPALLFLFNCLPHCNWLHWAAFFPAPPICGELIPVSDRT